MAAVGGRRRPVVAMGSRVAVAHAATLPEAPCPVAAGLVVLANRPAVLPEAGEAAGGPCQAVAACPVAASCGSWGVPCPGAECPCQEAAFQAFQVEAFQVADPSLEAVGRPSW